jgi:hypothetical protein
MSSRWFDGYPRYDHRQCPGRSELSGVTVWTHTFAAPSDDLGPDPARCTSASQSNIGLLSATWTADLIDPAAGSGRTPPRPDPASGPTEAWASVLAPIRPGPDTGRWGPRLERPPVSATAGVRGQ